MSQLVIDIHWFSGIGEIQTELTDKACLFLGSFAVYFFYLSWDYNIFLSIEILLKILNPHKESYKVRNFLYHFLAHLSSLVVFIILMTSGTNGRSVMKTCFIEKQTDYEIVVVVPVLLHFPICISIVGYTYYVSYGTYFKPYLWTHMVVVVVFSASIVPIALMHGFSYLGLIKYIPIWIVFVKTTQISVVFGALSGFFVFLARMTQRGLFKSVTLALFNPKLATVTKI
jgi:hypothetical protein